MNDVEALLNTVKSLNDELVSYADKPNKAKSLRVRKLVLQVKNVAPIMRAKLVELDKAGY